MIYWQETAVDIIHNILRQNELKIFHDDVKNILNEINNGKIIDPISFIYNIITVGKNYQQKKNNVEDYIFTISMKFEASLKQLILDQWPFTVDNTKHYNITNEEENKSISIDAICEGPCQKMIQKQEQVIDGLKAELIGLRGIDELKRTSKAGLEIVLQRLQRCHDRCQELEQANASYFQDMEQLGNMCCELRIENEKLKNQLQSIEQ